MKHFKFFRRNQNEGETFDKIVCDIRNQAKRYRFDDLKGKLMKIRILLGIQELRLQERLLTTPELNLEKTIHICISVELARHQQQLIFNADKLKNCLTIDDQKITRNNYQAQQDEKINESQSKTGYELFS